MRQEIVPGTLCIIHNCIDLAKHLNGAIITTVKREPLLVGVGWSTEPVHYSKYGSPFGFYDFQLIPIGNPGLNEELSKEKENEKETVTL